MRVARTGPLLTAALMAAFVAGAWTSPAAALDRACREKPTSTCVLQAAVKLARSLPDENTKGDWHLLSARALLGQLDDAVAAARKADNPDGTLGWIAAAMARTGRFDAALEVARGIAAPQWRSRALLMIAEAAIKADQGEVAGRVVEEARQLDIRSPLTDSPSPSLAGMLTRVGRLDQALQVAKATSDPARRAAELRSVVEALAEARRIDDAYEAGRLDKASRVANDITDSATRTHALLAVAAALVRAKQDLPADRLFEAAWQEANFVDADKEYAQQEVITAMARAGRLDAAEALAAKIAAHNTQAYALASIGGAHAVAGRTAKGRRLLQQARERANRDGSHSAVIMAYVVQYVVRAGAVDEAERLADLIDGAHHRAQAFTAIADELADKGELQRAQRAIASLPADHQGVPMQHVIRTWARVGVRERRMAMVTEALELAMKPSPGLDTRSQSGRTFDIELRVSSLISIGMSLAEAGL